MWRFGEGAVAGGNTMRAGVIAVAAVLLVLAIGVSMRPGSTAPGGISQAVSLPPPATAPILVVAGQIGITNSEAGATFDLALLDGLPQTSFTTATVWTDGPQAFSGVALKDLLAALGATGSRLEMTAVNDYVIEVPALDAVDGGPILATRLNGEVMSLRDKGPVWLVYPFDQNPEYQAEVYYARSIWQLGRIEVLP